MVGSASMARGAQKLKNEDCLACHSDPTLTKDVAGKQVSIAVDEKKFHASIHGSMFSCVDCHSDVKSLAHETPPKKVSCTQCHSDVHDAYLQSAHSHVAHPGDKPNANCEDCHGGVHQILPASDPQSPVAHNNIPNTCGRCHGQKFLMESNGMSNQPFLSYQQSVHGKATTNGNEKAAVCTDCHGAHQILAANDSRSPISKFNTPNTCGKCHADVASVYTQSIHGKALASGNQMAATCTDCHGIHTIQSHKDPNSPVSAGNLSHDTCARCHDGVRLSQEFGLPSNSVKSYMDTYHGLANQAGSVVAANCASCHGVHNILPSSDPHSTINKNNLEATCGKCHQGVSQKFIQTKVHQDGSIRSKDIDSVAVQVVRILYIVLIIIVIGAMFLHNAILWRYKALKIRAMQEPRITHMNPKMTRMTVNQRWQHLILLISFFVLVLTGFALKFPETWYAQIFGMGEHWRGIIHRIAGVVLMADGIYHLFYLAMLREGRRMLRDIAPRPRDLFDLFANMAYALGLSKKKPAFGRFNYAEKAEYWALVWGTALMGLTGVMLWAKVWVGNTLARVWVDLATTVHFYEAILATLAILVWHFYQIIFDPEVYPMNWAWYDGKMPVEQYKHEHPLDTESLAEVETRDEEQQ
jgi:cytochrome b subunit of formate dehydrogenase